MKDSKEKLFSVTLKDCDVQPYKGSGAGGQKRNKTESAIRIVHRESGSVGQSESFREQSKNKKEAFSRMFHSNKMQKWLKIEASRKNGTFLEVEKQVEQQVEKEMKTNIKCEVKNDKGIWTKIKPEQIKD